MSLHLYIYACCSFITTNRKTWMYTYLAMLEFLRIYFAKKKKGKKEEFIGINKFYLVTLFDSQHLCSASKKNF